MQQGLRDKVKELGATLGRVIADSEGEAWLDKIEHIRQLGKRVDTGDAEAIETLAAEFSEASTDDLKTIARAFSQFLNLANIAEQQYTVSDEGIAELSRPEPIMEFIRQLKQSEASVGDIVDAVKKLKLDLVLTAHPTEVTRRSLIYKQREIASDLAERDHANKQSTVAWNNRIHELIAQSWHTSEIRAQRPTPVDEARWGLAVIENSLWEAVPKFIRNLNDQLKEGLNIELPLDTAPVQFTSWMGGDRDGNPFVTAKVSREVLLLARWKAADLYLQDIELLISELSMSKADSVITEIAGDTQAPYRAVLKTLRNKLMATRDSIRSVLEGESTDMSHVLKDPKEFIEPLTLIYNSLKTTGLTIVANGFLLDTIRRVNCFGLSLIRLDFRQHSERHASAIAEITKYLGLGDYEHWDESQKQSFLLRELTSKRPLIPLDWNPSDDTKEVLDTCKVIAEQSEDMLGIYIISMASYPSDVLAVQLLLKESGVSHRMPVAPLFETLDDLDRSEEVIKDLLAVDWYRGYCQGHQHVMIGYSDSAKDAGVLAAAWAQYRAQESLVNLTKELGVGLTLFHGRGGTIGRGGGPAHEAILSQPPGSVEGGLRVTEQGETIRYKFGMPDIAVRSLELYASAVLEALLIPPPEPEEEWRYLMDSMAKVSCDAYRAVVREHPGFVPYFREATPESELGKLPLGSRPTKRKKDGGVESLRAIPWIFAWSQNRMVVPSWLGFGSALQQAIEEGPEPLLQQMIDSWPFFSSRLGMMEMVYTKSAPKMASWYDKQLVSEQYRPLGENLREQLAKDKNTLLSLLKQEELMTTEMWNRQSIEIRQRYLAPLHLIQVELMKRLRASGEEEDETLNHALMISIAGIAAGMRNTG